MPIGIKLTINGFDELENAEYIIEEKIFMDDEATTAHRKCSDFIDSLSAKVYARNSEVYPQFTVTKIYIG